MRGDHGVADAARPDGKLHLDRVRVRVDDGRYVCERAGVAGEQRALGDGRAPTAWRCLPDGDGVAAGAEVRVLLLT